MSRAHRRSSSPGLRRPTRCFSYRLRVLASPPNPQARSNVASAVGFQEEVSMRWRRWGFNMRWDIIIPGYFVRWLYMCVCCLDFSRKITVTCLFPLGEVSRNRKICTQSLDLGVHRLRRVMSPLFPYCVNRYPRLLRHWSRYVKFWRRVYTGVRTKRNLSIRSSWICVPSRSCRCVFCIRRTLQPVAVCRLF